MMSSIEEGILKLQQPENKLEVVHFIFENVSTRYHVVGVSDKDEKNNLGDYQNMTYFLMDKSNRKTLVIDPGIRGEKGYYIKETLKIRDYLSVLTHFHLDHWIGYLPYKDRDIYASQTCIDVLTGKRKTIKTFENGKLADGHRRETPQIAIYDAESKLPLEGQLIKPINEFANPYFPIQFYELPGQTLGMLYGVMETDNEKIVFGSDLFISLVTKTGEIILKVEPHYDFETDTRVIDNIMVALNAVLSESILLSEKDMSYYNEKYPNFEEHLKKLAKPNRLLLGHGIILMDCFYKGKIKELLTGLNIRNDADKRYVI
ncbi:hypothetical protein H8E77_35495 [bacterium]|nr:hypothetical protein [bacterium]